MKLKHKGIFLTIRNVIKVQDNDGSYENSKEDICKIRVPDAVHTVSLVSGVTEGNIMRLNAAYTMKTYYIQ
jgi:hypothetical protein